MRWHVAAGFAAIVTTIMLVSPGIAAASPPLLAAMNEVRAAHGLAPLRLDPRLQRAAHAHSSDMLRRNYFAHGPFVSRLTRFGVRGPRVGENLAWGVGTGADPRQVVRSWLASPRHRKNVLRRGFRRVGIGLLVGPFAGYSGATVMTADFAGR
jgi:uncharacterized protein YkwD